MRSLQVALRLKKSTETIGPNISIFSRWQVEHVCSILQLNDASVDEIDNSTCEVGAGRKAQNILSQLVKK